MKSASKKYKRVRKLTPVFVEFIPEQLEPGRIYISRKYATATHLCCCGCGNKVVTPLKNDFWSLSEDGDRVWLSPSIGNWSLECRSHYFIRGNHVDWLDYERELSWLVWLWNFIKNALGRMRLCQ